MSDLFAGLKADDYDRVYRTRHLITKIWHYLRAGRWTITGAAALAVGSSLLMSAIPIVIARVIDQTQAQAGAGPAAGSGWGWRLGLFVIVAAGSAWAMNWGRQVFTARLVGDVVYRLQCDAANAALDKDTAFYDRHSVGQVLSRVTGDTEGFSAVMTLSLNFLSQLFLVLLLGGLVFAVDLGLGLLVLAMATILLAVALLFRRIARSAAQNTRRVMARVNANVHETMLGIAVAKSFGQEQTVYRDFDKVNRQSYHVYLRQGLLYSVILPVLTLLSGLGAAAVLYAGGRFAILGELSAGDWYFALNALAMLWLPLTQAASFWSLFQQGLAASERVFALIDSPDTVVQTGAEPVGALLGDIELQDLCFSYTAGAPVFNGLSLRIGAGETVAIVGDTGAGKSSLAKLIGRSYEFQQGKLLIDGRDIRSFDLAGYRRQLGIVPQHPFLFTGTVAENIAYARPGADRRAVQDAVDRLGAQLWSRTMSLSLDDRPAGGEHGMSIGQRQLIALARVFLKQSAIVILDEPTASLDPLTEAGIQDAFSRLFVNRTVLVIAHRLSTIRKVDRILVLQHGTLVEEGSFDELLRRGGHFADVYATYYAHQEAEKHETS